MKKPVVVLLHLGYWLLFLLLLVVFFMMLQSYMPAQKRGHLLDSLIFGWGRLMLGFAIVPGVLAFYSFYTFLFTRFLTRKRLLLFFLYGIAVAAGCGVTGLVTLSLVYQSNLALDSVYELVPMFIIVTFGSVVNGIIGLVMRGFITWYGDIRLKEELSRRNEETELALIKSQLNPHFLFNTLNNIDVLIAKDPDKASAYLIQLSDILRFMLYETRTEEIPLVKELAYIEKYIALQKIRAAHAGYVHHEVHGDAGSWNIAPMLFIAFIENAFKHAESRKSEDAIRIVIDISAEQLSFRCINRYAADAQTQEREGGLGNALIKKRLALLYPQRHALALANRDETYDVHLILYRHAPLHHR